MQIMPSLAELQGLFMSNVLQVDTSIEPLIAANGLSSAKRLQVYRHIVENTLAEALQTSYPAVLLLVGEPFFEMAADRYMRRHPPQTGNLQDYGEQFPALLAAMAEAASVPYLSGVAELEWARQQTLLAASALALEASEIAYRLQYLGNNPIRMVLHPGAQVVCSEYPVFDIWHYCMDAPSEPLHLDGDGQSILLWRQGAQVSMQVIDRPAAVFLAAALDGMEMHQAFARVATEGYSDFDLSNLLPFLVANRLIIDIHPMEATE